MIKERVFDKGHRSQAESRCWQELFKPFRHRLPWRGMKSNLRAVLT